MGAGVRAQGDPSPEPCSALLPCPDSRVPLAAKKWLINAMVSFNPLGNIFPTCTE